MTEVSLAVFFFKKKIIILMSRLLLQRCENLNNSCVEDPFIAVPIAHLGIKSSPLFHKVAAFQTYDFWSVVHAIIGQVCYKVTVHVDLFPCHARHM